MKTATNVQPSDQVIISPCTILKIKIKTISKIIKTFNINITMKYIDFQR